MLHLLRHTPRDGELFSSQSSVRLSGFSRKGVRKCPQPQWTIAMTVKQREESECVCLKREAKLDSTMASKS